MIYWELTAIINPETEPHASPAACYGTGPAPWHGHRKQQSQLGLQPCWSRSYSTPVHWAGSGGLEKRWERMSERISQTDGKVHTGIRAFRVKSKSKPNIPLGHVPRTSVTNVRSSREDRMQSHNNGSNFSTIWEPQKTIIPFMEWIHISRVHQCSADLEDS